MLTLSQLKLRLTGAHAPKSKPSISLVEPRDALPSKPYRFGKFDLAIPIDHKIEEIHKVDLLYDRNFGPILDGIAKKYPHDTIIDIGANVGDTAAFIRTHCDNPIVCIEGGAPFLPYLRKNVTHLGDNIDVIEKFVMASANQGMTFGYESGAGTGVLSATTNMTSDTIQNGFVTIDALIDRQRARNSDICLVKSDTDGFDGPILEDVMAKLKTNLYFECDPNALVSEQKFDWPAFFDRLQSEHYSIAVFDNFGLPMFFADQDYAATIGELLHYVELQRTLRRISIYYYDVWAFRPDDHDLFCMARSHFKPRHQQL